MLAGTAVTSGTGSYIVTAVGTRTLQGQIIKDSTSDTEDTPLQTKLDDLATKIGYLGMGAAVLTFIAVMILMLTMVIPQISGIILASGQAVPLYTQIVLDVSAFFVNYGIYLLVVVVIGIFLLVYYARTSTGKIALDRFKVAIPFVGNFYKKLYVARIADNLSTSLASGITMVRAIELSASVVDSVIYKNILMETVTSIKGGASVSDTFAKYPEIPGIVTQMIKVGEETGELGSILKTVSKFYQREVNAAIDTLIGLIEPVMIIFLGVAVGILLASVLIPIYNVASSV